MNYEHFMKKALDKANEALSEGEFPVGCVIVYQDRILVSGSRTGTAGDSTNEIDHAEMIALRRLVELNEAVDKAKTTLFTTMEPCLMCLGALVLSGIGEIVYAYEDVMGGGTHCDLTKLTPLYKNFRPSIVKALSFSRRFFKIRKMPTGGEVFWPVIHSVSSLHLDLYLD